MFDSLIQTKVHNLPDNTTNTMLGLESKLTTVNSNITSAKTKIASAITSKGVPASASDDFITLSNKIGQITSETLGGSGIDVLITPTLPSTVKENQIVVLSSVQGKVYIDTEMPKNLKEGDIFMLLLPDQSFIDSVIDTSDVNLALPIHQAIQITKGFETTVDCFIGSNGKWEPTVKKEIYLFQEGIGTSAFLGGFTGLSGDFKETDDYLRISGIPNFGDGEAESNNTFDFTNYKTLEVEGTNGFTSATLSIGSAGSITFSSGNLETKTLDLTNINGRHKIIISSTCNYQYQYGYFYNIKVISK